MLSAMIEIADFTQFDKAIKVVFIVIELNEVTQRAALLLQLGRTFMVTESYVFYFKSTNMMLIYVK